MGTVNANGALAGYRVLDADGGERALALVESEPTIDLLITVVWVSYAIVFFGTIIKRKTPHIYVANWFYLSFIVTIAAVVQLTEMVIAKTSPSMHQVLGIYLPLITTNCAVLGVALLLVEPASLSQLLAPVFDPSEWKKMPVATRGLPASPGAASGQVVFSAEAAVEWAEQGRKVVLVRVETSPEDIHGMHAAEGILTTRGGMTSHAAVVARGMGKPAVCGAEALKIDAKAKQATVSGKDVVLREGWNRDQRRSDRS